LGHEEYVRADQEVEVVASALTTGIRNPDVAANLVYQVGRIAIQNEPLLMYYAGGRLAMGFATGLGPAATLGDMFQAVERGHRAVDAFVTHGFLGVAPRGGP
jgi:hypothetical protein